DLLEVPLVAEARVVRRVGRLGRAGLALDLQRRGAGDALFVGGQRCLLVEVDRLDVGVGRQPGLGDGRLARAGEVDAVEAVLGRVVAERDLDVAVLGRGPFGT